MKIKPVLKGVFLIKGICIISSIREFCAKLYEKVYEEIIRNRIDTKVFLKIYNTLII
jgi:hypothetical protein